MRDAGAGDQGCHTVKGCGARQIGQGIARSFGLFPRLSRLVPQQRLGPARQQGRGGGKAGSAKAQHGHLVPPIANDRNHLRAPFMQR